MTKFFVIKINDKPDGNTNKYETLHRCINLEQAENKFQEESENHPEWHLILNQISFEISENAKPEITVHKERKGEGMIEIIEDGLEKEDTKNVNIEDTVDLMLSSEYKDRFKAEYWQLRNRYTKLTAMLNKWDNDQLDFTPTCPRATYSKQIDAMHTYLDVLEDRASIEGVEL